MKRDRLKELNEKRKARGAKTLMDVLVDASGDEIKDEEDLEVKIKSWEKLARVPEERDWSSFRL